MRMELLNVFWVWSDHIISVVGGKWKYLKRATTTTYVTALLFLFLFITVSAFSYVGWIDLAKYPGHFFKIVLQNPHVRHQILEYRLDYNAWNKTNICPKTYPTYKSLSPNNSTCPEYFRWIHEDLRHWKNTEITREMLEKAKRHGHFRLIILDGRIYVERYAKYAIETRHLFTMYGITQLLSFYPGKLPNLEIMFDTNDRPVIPAREFRRPDSGPPPLFRYCSNFRLVQHGYCFPRLVILGLGRDKYKTMENYVKEDKRRE